MSAPAYAELSCLSNFSFLAGASHPEELAGAARAAGLAGFSVTDVNTLAGVVRAHGAAKEAEVAFRVGTRLRFRDGTPDVLVWPSDRAAYGRLCRLLTLGNRRAPKGECHLDAADLVAWGQGLMMAPLPARRPEPTLGATLDTLRQAFGREWVRLAATMTYQAGDRRRLAGLVARAKTAGVKLLAVNDVAFHAPTRRPLHDVMTCVREHVTLSTAGRRLLANAERHLKTPAAMTALFRDCPEAVSETLAVLEATGFSLDELRYEYPAAGSLGEADLGGRAGSVSPRGARQGEGGDPL